MQIKKASEFGEDIRPKISELFVEAFNNELKMFSAGSDDNALINACSHMFSLEHFYLAMIDGEIAGLIACLDRNSVSINPKRKIFVKNLGFFKGFLTNFMIKRYYRKTPPKKYPVEMGEKTGAIEFVATNAKFRGMGVATKMLNYAHAMPEYSDYILEVTDINANAIALYEKMGYKEVFRKKINVQKSGMNYLLYLKYSKK